MTAPTTIRTFSTAVFTAVSKPIEVSLPEMSLSIVPGMPMVLMPYLASSRAPRKVPSPPMAITPSMPRYLQLFAARCTPSSVRNSSLRAV